MPTLLAITASPRGSYSISNSLTHSFVDAWKAAHAGGEVVLRDLYQTELPFVDLPWIMGAYTPAEQHSEETKKAIAVSDKLIAELKGADHIVIGAPMYNFATPAILKAWIDHVMRVGLTFTPQYEGLVHGKKVTVIVASAGEYGPGSYMEKANTETAYLKQILGFMGMTDVQFVMAGGTSDVMQGKVTQEELLARHTAEIETAARA